MLEGGVENENNFGQGDGEGCRACECVDERPTAVVVVS